MKIPSNLLKAICYRCVTISITALAMLSACVYEKPEAPKVISKQFPIDAELVTFSVSLNFSIDNGKAYADDEMNFRRFIKEYLRRGRSKLYFKTVSNMNIGTERAVIARLVSRGVPAESIVVKRGKSTGDTETKSVISFKGYIVSVSKCANWMGEAGFNPTNKPNFNFGCSYYRNIGLMLSDPGDLTSPQGVVENDARRMDKAIRIFRDGSAAGVDLPKSEAGKFAGPSSK